MEIKRATSQIVRFPVAFWLILLLLLSGCKVAKIKDAELADKAGRYALAADIYNRIYRATTRKEPERKAYVAFKAAENYAAMHNYARALNLYMAALNYKIPDSLVLLHIADCYRSMNKQAEALKYYHRYLAYDPQSRHAQKGVQGIKEQYELSLNPYRFHVANEQKINSAKSDFGAVYTADGSTLYFSSARSRNAEYDNPVTGEKNNALYLIKKDAQGKWSRPDSVSGGINDGGDIGTPAITPDGTTLYYSYAPQTDDYPTTVKIYRSTRDGDGGWSKGQLVPLWEDSLKMAAHPTISANGRLLYFVSDGGYGGKDIYYIPIENIGGSRPINMGEHVNSAGDELFPTAVGDSLLYFSSNGRGGLGGLDLYRAELDSSATWHVTHLGAPMNSYADDYGIVFHPLPQEGYSMEGYFSSTRNDRRGYPHFFRFWQEAILTELEGFVFDREGNPIEGAVVRIVNQWSPEEELKVSTRADGYYLAQLSPGTKYLLLATHADYLNQYASFATETATENQFYSVDFHLAARHRPEVFQNIYYDFDKADLRPESQKDLDEMVKILQENPDIKVELSSHADRVGSDAYNEGLSERRANSVVDYLVSKGIDPSRLTAKGYGKTKPRDVTDAMRKKYPFMAEATQLDEQFLQTLSEEDIATCDQLNRRTEFTVLE